jgi:flagellar biosynthesis GTPase FlhF
MELPPLPPKEGKREEKKEEKEEEKKEEKKEEKREEKEEKKEKEETKMEQKKLVQEVAKEVTKQAPKEAPNEGRKEASKEGAKGGGAGGGEERGVAREHPGVVGGGGGRGEMPRDFRRIARADQQPELLRPIPRTLPEADFTVKETNPDLGKAVDYKTHYDLVEQMSYLFVRVVKARDLLPRDANLKSDPVCTIRIKYSFG